MNKKQNIIFMILIAVFNSMQVVHGQTTINDVAKINRLLDLLTDCKINEIIDYCYQHLDSPNTVQDLLSKASEDNGHTCKDACINNKDLCVDMVDV